ncbi:MAG: glycerophosphodiester phosphodiesterase [Clostridium sp.]
MKKLKNISILELVSQLYEVLKKTMWSYLQFEVIYKTLTLAIFIPIISVIFNKIVSMAKMDNITNYALLSFIFSKYGFLSIGILAPIAIILIYIEFSVLIIMFYTVCKGSKIKIKDAFLKSITNMSHLTLYGIVSMAMYLLILLPMFISGFGSSLIPTLEIPSFISGELYKTIGGTVLYLALILFIIYINIRWIFAIPVLVLEEKNNFKAALKKSAQLSKGNYFSIILTFITTLIFFLVVIILAISFLILLDHLIVNFLPNNIYRAIKFEKIFILFITISLYLSSLIMAPIYISIITKIYIWKVNPEDIIIKVDVIDYTDITSKNNIRYLKNNKVSLINFAIIIFCSIYLIGRVLVTAPSYGEITTIAHRGVISSGVENTIEAFQGAVDSKAEYAEIDLLQSKDGEVVVVHDSNLKRLAGVNEHIWNMTLDEIRDIELCQNDFKGRISTLEEVITFAKGNIKLLMEIKLTGNESNSFIDDILSIIKANNFEESSMLQSLDYDVVQYLQGKNINIKVGYILFAKISDLSLINADFLVMEESVVNENVVALCRILKKPLYVWTVNKSSNMDKFYLMGVQGIITDHPGELITRVMELKENTFY